MIRRLSLLCSAVLLLGAAEPESQPKPLPPAEAAKQGRQLAAEILAQTPDQDSQVQGFIEIRRSKTRKRTGFSMSIHVLDGKWLTRYSTSNPGKPAEDLVITHSANAPNQYSYQLSAGGGGARTPLPGLSPAQAATQPFAESDFSLADLGLEFLHWPEQRLLKTQMRRGRSCRVLESINPQPAPGAYSRVVSWIDIESKEPVFAQAYDFQGKLLKEFAPKDVQKVRGRWELKGMQLDNRQTGSSTRIEFNLDQV